MKIGTISEDSFSHESYFPTLVFRISCSAHEELNKHLLDLIYQERERDQKGIERSNYKKLGGWHSHNNLHREAAYKPLTDRINQAGERISKQLEYDPDMRLKIGTMWSIINPPGSSNKSHVHPGAQWSGVYYLNTPKNAGDIEFTDPRTAQVMQQANYIKGKKRLKEGRSRIRCTPKAGLMLIFPSWLYHSVDPNLSEKSGKASERVIISFNMRQRG